MFIQTEATPNPATLKFIPGRIVAPEHPIDIRSRDEATQSPLAEALFAVEGVSGVFYGSDFIAVTRQSGEWDHLKPAILGAIMEHYMSVTPPVLHRLVGHPGMAGAIGADIPASGAAEAEFRRGRIAKRPAAHMLAQIGDGHRL